MKLKRLFQIKRLFAWIKRIWHWLVEGETVFKGLLVVLLVLAGIYTWPSEDTIRRAGLLLQMLGMIFAIYGLLRVRTHFGQEPFRQLFVDWWKRFPQWRKHHVLGAGSLEVATAVMDARCETWTPDRPDQPIEKRIEDILKNLDRIRKEQGQHANIIEKLSTSSKKLEKAVKEESKNTIKEIRSDLETLHTGDLVTALVGLMWLTIGISMSTIPKELFELIQ